MGGKAYSRRQHVVAQHRQAQEVRADETRREDFPTVSASIGKKTLRKVFNGTWMEGFDGNRHKPFSTRQGWSKQWLMSRGLATDTVWLCQETLDHVPAPDTICQDKLTSTIQMRASKSRTRGTRVSVCRDQRDWSQRQLSIEAGSSCPLRETFRFALCFSDRCMQTSSA